jgi:hypothetical protein
MCNRLPRPRLVLRTTVRQATNIGKKFLPGRKQQKIKLIRVTVMAPVLTEIQTSVNGDLSRK